MKQTITDLLTKVGIDLSDPNFKDTPDRVDRALLQEILAYQNEDFVKEEIAKIVAKSFPAQGYNSIVIVANIKTYSMCPHHLLPVDYEIDIGYLPNPNGFVLGLCKLVRISDILSKRLCLQEKLTEDIANVFIGPLKAEGVGVIVQGTHYCMRMRGVKQATSIAITSTMMGSFLDDASNKQEFLELLKIHKRR